MWKQALKTLLFAGLSTAHFILLWPPNSGFDEDKEPTGPCGGFTPKVTANSPDVQVDGFAISIQNVHPVGEWSFRGTTSTKAPYDFTEIVPVVNTTGIGDFCLDMMSVPSNWAGKSGIIQVVDNSPDGILYQCAPVNFVSGSNSTIGDSCMNATSFEATWTSQESFPGEDGGTGSTTSISPTAQSPTASSSSSSGVAAVVTGVGSLVGGIGLLAAGLAL